MIRPTLPGDTTPLLDVARGTGVFRELEVEALREVLDDYHESNQDAGHVCVTYEHDNRIVGIAYYAQAAMTDRTWYLWWIIVEKAAQGLGIGGKLLDHAEDAIRNRGGRLMLIETSSLPMYEPTRRFYLKHGYAQVATIADFYTDGDSLNIFAKRFLAFEETP